MTEGRSPAQDEGHGGDSANRENLTGPDSGGFYEILVAGHLDAHWSAWLGNLSVTHLQQGDTLLFGSIADQAALYGILYQIRDLGLQLIALRRLEGAGKTGRIEQACTDPHL